jgi:ankyrin repeat protein
MSSDALFAAVRQADLTALSAALQMGADLDARDEYGDTAFLAACNEGGASVVEWLLDHAADMRATRSNGETGLMLAAESNAVDTLALLIARGADIRARDEHGCTALILAAEYNAWNAARALVDSGADVNAATLADGTVSAGRTALMWAAGRASLEGVRLLLESGARIDAQDAQRMTAIHTAALEECNGDVVQHLAFAGADLNRAAHGGLTPLMCAAMAGDETTVRALLDRGAQLEVRDTAGRTALDLAKIRGHEKIIAELTR